MVLAAFTTQTVAATQVTLQGGAAVVFLLVVVLLIAAVAYGVWRWRKRGAAPPPDDWRPDQTSTKDQPPWR